MVRPEASHLKPVKLGANTRTTLERLSIRWIYRGRLDEDAEIVWYISRCARVARAALNAAGPCTCPSAGVAWHAAGSNGSHSDRCAGNHAT